MNDVEVQLKCPRCKVINVVTVSVITKDPESYAKAVKRLDPCCSSCRFHLAWFVVNPAKHTEVITK